MLEKHLRGLKDQIYQKVEWLTESLPMQLLRKLKRAKLRFCKASKMMGKRILWVWVYSLEFIMEKYLWFYEDFVFLWARDFILKRILQQRS